MDWRCQEWERGGVSADSTEAMRRSYATWLVCAGVTLTRVAKEVVHFSSAIFIVGST